MEPDSTSSDDYVMVVPQVGGLDDVAFVDAVLEELENIPLPAPEDPVFMLPAQPAEVKLPSSNYFSEPELLRW